MLKAQINLVMLRMNNDLTLDHIRKGHQLLKMQKHLDSHISSDDTVAAPVTASVTKLLTVCSHSFQLIVPSFFSFLDQ